jgi:HSP20 family protein
LLAGIPSITWSASITKLSSYLDSFRQLPNLFGAAFTPAAHVQETDDAHIVEIELPGVQRDDIDIEIAGRRRIALLGERREKEPVGILRRRERTVGRFHDEVTLPGDVDEDGVERHLDETRTQRASPKAASARARRIEIR